ncbi:hypothetical protein [Flavobacterium sp.]|uniref:hypothetical protein n=1 Tax=Flavobacterium sp. TaxID=239 RepID=UPI0026057AD8|nr:hypothetical protein [Flavobacterium sp.]
METCSTKNTIHQRMGTTQSDRFLDALRTDYFLIDERTETDYIEVVQKLSAYVKYFNIQDINTNSWEPFFLLESTSVLISIFSWNMQKLQEEYKTIANRIRNTQAGNNKEILKQYFDGINNKLNLYDNRVKGIDSSIPAKDALLQSIQQINNLLNEVIIADINSRAEGEIQKLVKEYRFEKNVQQLFGLLQNWKNTGGDSIKQQLDSYAGHTPHYTLLLAFLKLLGIAREDLNKFTGHHLDFYYKDILRMQPKAAVPDKVHLLAQPGQINKSYVLPKGTIFLGGKNELGQNRYYASTANHNVNTITLKHLFSAFINSTPARRQADLTEINKKDIPFNVFPNPNQNEPYLPYDYASETGIMVASPLLYLSGGDRYILINISGTVYDDTGYRFFLTGEKGVIEVTTFESLTPGQNGRYLYLPPTTDKIVGYDAELHKGIKVKDTQYPVLKIVPKENVAPIRLNDESYVSLTIKVRNFKDYLLATDTGSADTAKPFYPFGEYPKNGNGFIIGANEFFVKEGASIKVNTGISVGTSIFKMNASGWVPTPEGLSTGITNDYPLQQYEPENSVPVNESIAGYIRVELNDPDYENNNTILDTTIQDGKLIVKTPQGPVVKSVTIDYDVTDSTASAKNPIETYELLPFGYQQKKLPMLRFDTALNTVRAFPLASVQRLRVFEPVLESVRQIRVPAVKQVQQLAESGGDIYLGFANAQAGNSFSVLFQLAEGTVNPMRNPATISWKYLKNNNGWQDFKSYELADATNGLLQSGLVTFTVPEDFTDSSITILPDGLFWIKINVDVTDAISDFVGVHEQALQAELVAFDKSDGVFLSNIPKDTVTKLYQPLNYIKKITQPYPSFGGSRKEESNMFYVRSSERLRHKNRAITLWDYERLILQEFPQLIRVKCLNHYNYVAEHGANTAAGYISIIPLARWSKSTIIYLKPLVSLETMQNIKAYVAGLGSPHARIMVKPPLLEKIRLNFSVKYRQEPGTDVRVLESQLVEAINRFLSPWAYDTDAIDFSGEIEISSLIQLVDDLPYVDFVTKFKVDQLVPDPTKNNKYTELSDVKSITPTTDYTLFIPNEAHNIIKITECTNES